MGVQWRGEAEIGMRKVRSLALRSSKSRRAAGGKGTGERYKSGSEILLGGFQYLIQSIEGGRVMSGWSRK